MNSTSCSLLRFPHSLQQAEGKLFDASVTAETGQDEGDSCHDVLSARRGKRLAGPSVALSREKQRERTRFSYRPAGPRISLSFRFSLPYTTRHVRSYTPARTPLPQPPSCPTTPRRNGRHPGGIPANILLVTGDACVDHPSFGVPLLGRWLVGHGYRVGIVAQPRWKDEGRASPTSPAWAALALFAGVGAGALDSMLAHCTFRKKRHDDAYTPGGEARIASPTAPSSSRG